MLRSLCLALNNGLRQFIAKLKNNKSVTPTLVNPSENKVVLPFLAIDASASVVESVVDNKTVIGRRLLPDHFSKSTDGRDVILFKAFIDTRVNENLSFDALGYSGNPDKAVINALRPIIKKHFELNSINYVAWSGIKKKTIPDLKVYSTPDKNPLNINEHHCDLDRSDFRTIPAARALAYRLAFHANNDEIFILATN